MDHTEQTKKQTSSFTFPLTSSGIDSCSEILESQLIRLGIETQNRIRLRFSLEEALLRMRDHFGEDSFFVLSIDNFFGRIQIQITMEGDIFNPLSKTQVELEDWSGTLLTAVGLSPLYSYVRGRNILRINLRQKSMNPALKLLIAVASGLITGLLIRYLLSADILTFIANELLRPFYDLWLRVLNLLSGPTVFIMVLTSLLNVHTIKEEGGNSRLVVARYFMICGSAALMVAIPVGLLLRNMLSSGDMPISNAADYLDILLRLVPQDLITPIMQGNTPQLLLVAYVLGKVIAESGPKTDNLRSLIRQGNMIFMIMTDIVSQCVPFFASLLLTMEVLTDNLKTFGGLWVILIVAIILNALLMAYALFRLARGKKIPARRLAEKLLPAFITAIRTGGLDEGYGQMAASCTSDLGIEKHFATVSLPFGFILCTPANVIGTLLFTVFAAIQYQVRISPLWMIFALILAVVLFVATPPVPGMNLLAYIILFAQLGIPQEALIDAMIFDILFGIFAGAFNQALLQLDLVVQADAIGLLDETALRS